MVITWAAVSIHDESNANEWMSEMNGLGAHSMLWCVLTAHRSRTFVYVVFVNVVKL